MLDIDNNIEKTPNVPIMVILKPQDPLFPLLSTALHAIACCPMVKLVPAVGVHETLTVSPLLSIAVGKSHSTIADGCP